MSPPSEDRRSLRVLVTVVILLTASSSTLSDDTRTPGANGAAVVEDVCRQIESSCIFNDDKLFTRRLAFVETTDGTDDIPSDYSGGIWKVRVLFRFCSHIGYCKFIPEQFTVKAHPASFEGKGRGAPKMRHCYSSFIPVNSWHTLSKRAQNIIPVYSWHALSKRAQNIIQVYTQLTCTFKRRTKTQKNCDGSHSMHLYWRGRSESIH